MQATFNIPNALAAHLPKEYRRQLDLAAQADIHKAIRQGRDHVANGRTRPADEFFAEFRESMANRLNSHGLQNVILPA